VTDDELAIIFEDGRKETYKLLHKMKDSEYYYRKFLQENCLEIGSVIVKKDINGEEINDDDIVDVFKMFAIASQVSKFRIKENENCEYAEVILDNEEKLFLEVM